MGHRRPELVAQAASLPYRRLPVGENVDASGAQNRFCEATEWIALLKTQFHLQQTHETCLNGGMVKLCAAILFATASVLAQTNPPAVPVSSTNENAAVLQHVEELRARCINNRRIICGKILKILPDGIIVDSGYTNLMRVPLNQSWLIPGNTTADRATNFVEGAAPDSVCLGQVFLIDLPKPPRGMRPKLFDYVILEGFPMGKYTYTSVGDVQHTVRQFSNKVTTAVRWMYGQEIEEQEKKPPSKD